jgi:hypothetical protein
MNTLAHTILNRSNALRVSDRSGTPQAGDPAEEYSGVRDPEALRGGTPKLGTVRCPRCDARL